MQIDLPAAPRLEAKRLARLPPGVFPRIGLDVVAWCLLAWAGDALGGVAVPIAAFVIGFVFAHHLLICGHDAVHRLVSANRRVNDAWLWLLHAPFGMSGLAHRAFHLTHHRHTHVEDDPEYAVVRRLGGRGWSYLVLPLFAPLGVYAWAWRNGGRALRLAVVRDTVGIAALHGALALLLGPRVYLTWVQLPLLLGLWPAFAIRSLAEHHGRPRGDRWRSSGALHSSRLMQVLWSNIDHHLEHHLFPFVPMHHLPGVRTALRDTYARKGIHVEGVFPLVFVERLALREHFAPKEPSSNR